MFKRNIFLVVLISSFLVLFFICSMAEATKYVNCGSTSSGAGTRANPYNTIQQGITEAGYGETVLVAFQYTDRDGRTHECIYDEHITLESGVRVIGGATIDGSSSRGPVVTAIGVDRALFQGFRIIGGN